MFHVIFLRVGLVLSFARITRASNLYRANHARVRMMQDDVAGGFTFTRRKLHTKHRCQRFWLFQWNYTSISPQISWHKRKCWTLYSYFETLGLESEWYSIFKSSYKVGVGLSSSFSKKILSVGRLLGVSQKNEPMQVPARLKIPLEDWILITAPTITNMILLSAFYVSLCRG